MDVLRRIDSAIMGALAWATSSRGAFYALNMLIITAVVISPPQNLYEWLLVVVSVYYQGVALPGLGNNTKVEGDVTRKLLQETHDTVVGELAELRQMHLDEQETRAEMQAAQARIEQMLQNISPLN